LSDNEYIWLPQIANYVRPAGLSR